MKKNNVFLIKSLILLIVSVNSSVYATNSPDMFETDSPREIATSIFVNDLKAQAHTFHEIDDEDWVVFFAEAGFPYSIQIDDGSVGIDADPVIQIFNEEGEQVTPTFNFGFEGEGELMDWNATVSGMHYVRISNNLTTLGDNTKYKLRVFMPLAPFSGMISGSVTDKCTQEFLGRVNIKSVRDEARTHDAGGYSMPVLPGVHQVTASKQDYLAKSSAVQVAENQLTTLNFELETEGGCSFTPTDSDSGIKPPNATYFHSSGTLIIKDIDINLDGRRLQVTLKNEGGFKFVIDTLIPTVALLKEPAFFDPTANTVNISRVLFNKRYYSIRLNRLDNTTFQLDMKSIRGVPE